MFWKSVNLLLIIDFYLNVFFQKFYYCFLQIEIINCHWRQSDLFESPLNFAYGTLRVAYFYLRIIDINKRVLGTSSVELDSIEIALKFEWDCHCL